MRAHPQSIRIRRFGYLEKGVEPMCLGIPGELIEVRDVNGLRVGKVRFAGITRDVCLECQTDADVGDFVLVHVGFVIAKIDREEAARAWSVLQEIGQLGDLFPEGDAR